MNTQSRLPLCWFYWKTRLCQRRQNRCCCLVELAIVKLGKVVTLQNHFLLTISLLQAMCAAVNDTWHMCRLYTFTKHGTSMALFPIFPVIPSDFRRNQWPMPAHHKIAVLHMIGGSGEVWSTTTRLRSLLAPVVCCCSYALPTMPHVFAEMLLPFTRQTWLLQGELSGERLHIVCRTLLFQNRTEGPRTCLPDLFKTTVHFGHVSTAQHL